MAFSLFNKKGSEPPKPHGAARPASRTPSGHDESKDTIQGGTAAAESAARRDTAGKIDRIEAQISATDLSNVTAEERKTGKLVVEHGFQGGTKPRATARHTSTASDVPAKQRAPDSVMTMEIQESPFEAAPALEEAAILYANRQDGAALGALEEAVGSEDIPPQAARQAWMMLFDLFENQGRRADFEAAALQYAVRFETSPPGFKDRSTIKDAAALVGAGPQVDFGHRLDATAARQFEHLRIVAAKNRQLRVDLTRIEGVDPAGCDQLRSCMAGLRKSGHDVTFAGAAHLVDLLSRLVEVGRADIPEAYWMLLLDLHQALDLQAEFEETALNYCITYEVSPPSWIDTPKKPAIAASQAGPAIDQAPDDALYLEGEIEGTSDTALKSISDFAAEREPVIIDVFNVKRMDFIAAGSLLNLVAALKTAGKQVEIRSPSPLLATLLVTMGFTAYAKLVRRKS